MRYLGDDEATQMSGIGLYQGTDGNLYEWVEGVDAWGDSIGFWQGVSQPEDSVLSGLGALYQAPDGTLYQMHGLAEDAETGTEAEPEAEKEPEAGEEQPMKAMGPRAQRRRRFFRRRPHRPGPGVKGGAPRKKKGGFLKKLLPIAKFATRFIPGIGPVASAGLDVAGKLLKRKKGVAGYDGLGALYAAPDGSLYQVQGLADEELQGFAEDEELKGFAEDEELRGLAEDEELRGLDEDQELRGLDEDEELRGFDADDDLRGFDEDRAMQGIDGYVRQDGMSGLDAYVPQAPPQTRWHVTPVQVAEIWKPLW
jgi:hypothetical protein